MSIRTALSDISFMNSLFTSAEAVAHELGDEVMAPEHLVIAALERDDLDSTGLVQVGLDAQRFRAAVIDVHAQALHTVGVAGAVEAIVEPPRGPLHSTTTAQEVFQDARRRARARRAPLRAVDILAAAARLEQGTTVRALAQLGVDPAALETLDR